jgi:ribosomal protein L21E
MKDTNFTFSYKSFAFQQDKKFTLSQLEKLLEEFQQPKHTIIGYVINNIIVNNEPQKYILGKTGQISFGI